MGAPRMTLPTQLVLRALLDEPAEWAYGFALGRATGLPSGTIHPILARLEKIGWVTSDWEQIDPSEQGRPRRRYYRLNPDSIALVQSALARAKTPTAAIGRLIPRPA